MLYLLAYCTQIIIAVAINKERPPLPADTPDRLASLVQRCWLEDPKQRPRVSQLAAELQDMLKVTAALHGSWFALFSGLITSIDGSRFVLFSGLITFVKVVRSFLT